MSIYPVIPITQFYNNAVTYDPRAAKVELGKGGVLDRSRIHFFNNTRKNYSISAVLKDKDTLQNFLELNRGKPFEFRYDGSNSAGLYICKTWSWDWVVYVDGVSGVWNFSATFEQVFRPGWVSDTTGLGTLTLGAITVTGTGLISINPSGSLTMTGSGSLETSNVTVSGSGNVVTGSTLLTGLLAWYSMGEASGNALDSHTGGYTLTQSGTVGSTTGKVGNARSFNGSASNHLSSSNSVFQFSATFYGALWVRITGSTGNNQNVLGRWLFNTNNRSYQLTFTTSNTIVWVLSSNGTSSTAASTSLTVSETAFIEFYYDSVAGQIGIAKNGAAFTTTAFAGGLFVGSANFYVGRYQDSTSNSPLNGWLDELALWNRILTTDERTELYNSGAGRGYPG